MATVNDAEQHRRAYMQMYPSQGTSLLNNVWSDVIRNTQLGHQFTILYVQAYEEEDFFPKWD